MHKPEINLFRHPTTTVFVDDSEEFLYSIALGVDRLPYRSFCNPAEALAYVNHFARAYDLRAGEIPGAGGSLGKLFAQVERKLNDINRFAEPSVLVVDYSMPSMNGLDLCSQITNPNIKKVLLTGVADEKVAIDALNTELIDFYISKSESSLSQRLRNIITHLEGRYFQDLFGWTKDSEVRDALPQLFDSAFADFFEDTAESLQVVEHYPIRYSHNHPDGFCLVSAYGDSHYLLVYSAEQLEAMLAHMDLSRLSQTASQQLARRSVIPILPPAWSSAPLEDKHLHGAQLVHGARQWYCSLIEGSRLGLRPPVIRTTYQQFLKTPPQTFRPEEVLHRQ